MVTGLDPDEHEAQRRRRESAVVAARLRVLMIGEVSAPVYDRIRRRCRKTKPVPPPSEAVVNMSTRVNSIPISY